MQSIAWKNELTQALGITATGVLLGVSAGVPLWGLTSGLLATVVFMFATMLNFYRWVAQQQTPPPQAGLLGYSADHLIRQEKALQQKIEQQQQVLERHFQGIDSLHDGVLILENTGQMLHFNRAAQQLLNLRAQDKGQLLTNLVRNPRLKEYLTQVQLGHALPTDTVQIDVRHPRHYFLHIQATGFGSEQKLVLVQDITERQKIETMRKSFIANASHELRTPLTVINGYLELFPQIDDSAQQLQIISKLEQQSSRMKELIDDLLHLSKLETDTPYSSGEWFDLKHLAYSVIQQLPEEWQARVEFAGCVEIDVLGFMGELHTVLTNLLSNALKYSDHTPVSLNIDASFNGVKITVSDQGPGIAREHLPHLTERFYRADESHKTGSGLGLAIVKHALELYGSRLEVQSEVGQGSEFSFVLHPERCRFHR